jgi:hypothetical protein
MDERAWWISPAGTIYPVTRSHIAVVIADPGLFGLTRAYIETVYEKHKEPLGWEGKAREEILKGLITQGFIRIRDYKNYLSVQVLSLNQHTINRLLHFFKAGQFSRSTEVRLAILSEGKTRSTTVADLKEELGPEEQG